MMTHVDCPFPVDQEVLVLMLDDEFHPQQDDPLRLQSTPSRRKLEVGLEEESC